MNPPENFYRYELKGYPNIDQFGDPAEISWNLYMYKYDLLKKTPKGYWIGFKEFSCGLTWKKWISKTAKKRYAYPTEKEALNAYILRSKRRVEILEDQTKNTKYGIYLAEQKIKTLQKIAIQPR